MQKINREQLMTAAIAGGTKGNSATASVGGNGMAVSIVAVDTKVSLAPAASTPSTPSA